MELCVRTTRGPDGSYLAFCPALPSCCSHGWSLSQVLTKHRRAILDHIASGSKLRPPQARLTFYVVPE